MKTIELNIMETAVLLVTLEERLSSVKDQIREEQDSRAKAHLTAEMFTLEELIEKTKS